MFKKIFVIVLVTIVFSVSAITTFASDTSYLDARDYYYCCTPLDLSMSTYATLEGANIPTFYNTFINDFSSGYTSNSNHFNWVYNNTGDVFVNIYGYSGVYGNSFRDIYIPIGTSVSSLRFTNSQFMIIEEEATSNQIRLFLPYSDVASSAQSLTARISYKVLYSYLDNDVVQYGYDTINDTIVVTPPLPPTPITIRGELYVQYNFAKFRNLISTINTQQSYYPLRNYNPYGYITIEDYSMSIDGLDNDGVYIRDLTHYSLTDVQSARVETLRTRIAEDTNIDVDFTDWISNAVSGFMNFELIPGINIGALLAFCVALGLFLMFLKIWAGG